VTAGRSDGWLYSGAIGGCLELCLVRVFTCALIVLQNLHMEVHNNILFKPVSWIYLCEDAKRLI